MTTEDTVLGWTQRQWAWIAEFYLRRQGSLPQAATNTAIDVSEFWENHQPGAPSEPLIVGVDMLGRPTPPLPVHPLAERYAQQLFIYAKSEFLRIRR